MISPSAQREVQRCSYVIPLASCSVALTEKPLREEDCAGWLCQDGTFARLAMVYTNANFALLPVVATDNGDEATAIPDPLASSRRLPLLLGKPPADSLALLPNAARQLSPSRLLLEQRWDGDHFPTGEDGREEGEDEAAAAMPSSIHRQHFREVLASPSKVKRFSLLPQLSNAGDIPKWNHFYTEASVNQRMQLMLHPKVKQALDHLWTAANFNAEDEIIDREEYLLMHRKLALALEPSTYPLEALDVALEDWALDSEGKPGLDR